MLAASGDLDVEGATPAAGLDLWRRGRARVSAGPLAAYLSYTGIEDGEYQIGIDHGDGTYAVYVHLTQNGALVEVGALVAAGQPIALSGRSGALGIDPPHLHLELLTCNADFSRCQTVPLTFRNASPPAPNGLQLGVTYTALP